MKYRQIALALLTAAALVAAAAFVTTSPVSADVSAAPVDQLELARAMRANCQILASEGTSSAQRSRGRLCRADQQFIIDRLTAATPTPTSSPTASPTTSLPPPSTPPPTSSPPAAGYPSPATTGVPMFWQPTTSRGSWTITAAGTYEDVRVTGDITVAVANVTLRRVEVVDGRIVNETRNATPTDDDDCNNGLVVEDSTIRSSGSSPYDPANGAITPGGYTARRVKVWNVTEGFRAGGGSVGCGPIHVEQSFALIRGGICHCDGLQVYDGAGVYVDGLTIDWAVSEGTTAFFAPSGEAAGGPVQVRHLLLKGGGDALWDQIPGFVEDYFYVKGSAVYGAMRVDCSIVSPFSARIGTIDAAYQPTSSSLLACGSGNGQ